MDELRRLELNELVVERAREVPLLGICLGMQVLLDFSEENGGVPSLGLIPGRVRRFPDPPPDSVGERMKVPHMGWNQVHWTRPHALTAGVPDRSWFYFVHSYYAVPKNAEHMLGESQYGETFAAAVARDTSPAISFIPKEPVQRSAAAGELRHLGRPHRLNDPEPFSALAMAGRIVHSLSTLRA